MIVANECIIMPRGSVYEMIEIMISAQIYASYHQMKIKMIWDHKVKYPNLFVGNIECVETSYLQGKQYIYNPSIDQGIIYNNIKVDQNVYFIIIIDTNKIIRLESMSDVEYMKRSYILYDNLLKEYISGSLLGRLNMISFPQGIFCVNKTDDNVNVSTLELDLSDLDVQNDEMIEYITILAYSKAEILITDNVKEDEELERVAKVRGSMIIYKNYKSEKIRDNESIGLFGYPTVVNPNTNNILLLL